MRSPLSKSRQIPRTAPYTAKALADPQSEIQQLEQKISEHEDQLLKLSQQHEEDAVASKTAKQDLAAINQVLAEIDTFFPANTKNRVHYLQKFTQEHEEFDMQAIQEIKDLKEKTKRNVRQINTTQSILEKITQAKLDVKQKIRALRKWQNSISQVCHDPSFLGTFPFEKQNRKQFTSTIKQWGTELKQKQLAEIVPLQKKITSIQHYLATPKATLAFSKPEFYGHPSGIWHVELEAAFPHIYSGLNIKLTKFAELTRHMTNQLSKTKLEAISIPKRLDFDFSKDILRRDANKQELVKKQSELKVIRSNHKIEMTAAEMERKFNELKKAKQESQKDFEKEKQDLQNQHDAKMKQLKLMKQALEEMVQRMDIFSVPIYSPQLFI